jgi:hypothetical protein
MPADNAFLASEMFSTTLMQSQLLNDASTDERVMSLG